MQKLSLFTQFNWEAFAKDKKFGCIGTQEWIDRTTSTHKGTKVKAVIVRDATNYGCKDGEIITNLYEKVDFKVPKDIDIPLNVEIQPKGVTATVYGEYRNMLSIQAEDIIVVTK